MLWEGEPGRGRANSVIGLRPRERWIVQSAQMMATTLQAAIVPPADAGQGLFYCTP